MSPAPFVTPVVDSTSVFKSDIFNGKVVFVTGGGSGICRVMTEAMVCLSAMIYVVGVLDEIMTADAPWCKRNDCWPQVGNSIYQSSLILMKPIIRLDRLTQTAKELSEATGQKCLPAQADVRQPKQVQDAVAKTVKEYGKIDYVISGAS